jgi:hypothetical protein
MSTTETRTAELRQGVDGIDWRHFWLKNVMIDSGKLAPTKISRRELQKNALSGVCENFIARERFSALAEEC